MNRKASDGTGVLDLILDRKRAEVGRLEERSDYWRERAEAAPVPPSFEGALRAGPAVALIGEVKRRSPSAGELGADLATRALAYASGGAAAISVLTDGPFFGGSLADLQDVGAAVALPLLRKDFILAPVQLWQARAGGAAAVLLIARVLDDARLRTLRVLAEELRLAPLVEVHGVPEVERALAAGARIIGVNNRDLDTLAIDLDTTIRLAPRVPGDLVLVGESGIRSVQDVARLADAGVDAVLVGEALMRSGDALATVRALAAVPRKQRP